MLHHRTVEHVAVEVHLVAGLPRPCGSIAPARVNHEPFFEQQPAPQHAPPLSTSSYPTFLLRSSKPRFAVFFLTIRGNPPLAKRQINIRSYHFAGCIGVEARLPPAGAAVRYINNT